MPYYLDMLKPIYTAEENIDHLCGNETVALAKYHNTFAIDTAVAIVQRILVHHPFWQECSFENI